MIVASIVVAAACSWNNPGANPWQGTTAQAVDSYKEIPLVTRNKLKARMEKRAYDDVVDITAFALTSNKHTYAPEIESMHFGANKLCLSVDRSKWNENMKETGLVYCEDDHCLIVPTVCRNVSKIRRYVTSSTPPVAIVPPSGGSYTPPEYLAPPPPVSVFPVAPPKPYETVVYEAPPQITYNQPPQQPFFPPHWNEHYSPPIAWIPPSSVIAPVPEPETYAMFATGLGVIGWVVRRKKSKKQ